MRKLAIITTHPIQYNAPLFRLLAERKNIAIKVFYTWGQSGQRVYDPGFGKVREWDIPLLDGYDYEFIENISSKPGSHHFQGIDNPDGIKKIEAWKPDALLVFGWSFKSHLKILKHFKNRIPVWFRGDSNLLDELPGFSFKKIARRFFLKWVFSHVDKAFYVGEANKKYFIVHGLTPNQLEFAPHAIDNGRFADNDGVYSQKAVEWRHALGIGLNEKVILFAGKFEAKKNPQVLINVANKMPYHLILVGNGHLNNDLKKAAANNDRIHFLPFQNQSTMPVVYRLANVFILPSIGPGETWGLAVNEAMACGLPVIVSDKSGCGMDLVEEGKNGFICNNDETGLVYKINKIFTEVETEKKMGLYSKNKIAYYSFDTIAMALEKAMATKQIF